MKEFAKTLAAVIVGVWVSYELYIWSGLKKFERFLQGSWEATTALAESQWAPADEDEEGDDEAGVAPTE